MKFNSWLKIFCILANLVIFIGAITFAIGDFLTFNYVDLANSLIVACLSFQLCAYQCDRFDREAVKEYEEAKMSLTD